MANLSTVIIPAAGQGSGEHRQVKEGGRSRNNADPTAHSSISPASGTKPLIAQETCRPIRLVISTKVYRRLWVLLFMVTLLNAGHLFLLASIYLSYNLFRVSFLGMLLSAFLFEPDELFMAAYSKWIGATYALLCFVFTVHCLRMLIISIRHRELRFDHPPADTVPTIDTIARSTNPRKRSVPVNYICSNIHGRLITCGKQIWRKLMLQWAEYGVRGNHFHRGLIVRELVELLMQSMQGYNASLAISNKRIVQSYGVVIALNSVMHPLLARAFGPNKPMYRFASVFAESFMDVSWGSILPLWMFLPYLQMDASTTSEQIVSQNPIGYHEMAQGEIRHNLVLSTQAFILSIFPFVGSLMSLQAVKNLLAASSRCNVTAVGIMEQVPERKSSSCNLSHDLVFEKRAHLQQAMHSDPTVCKSKIHADLAAATDSNRILRGAYAIIAVYGCFIFAVSMDATAGVQHIQPIAGHACGYRLSPWFVRKDACTVWSLNCTERGIAGRDHELAVTLSNIHQGTLSSIMFFSCPGLEIPAKLVQLQKLRTIAIFDSHLLQWSPDATITSSHFPRVSTLYLKQVSFAPEPELPIELGLPVQSETLQRVVFSNVPDMDRIVERTTTQWRFLTAWGCYTCSATHFPTILYANKVLEKLILTGSMIRDIPDVPFSLDEATVWPTINQLILAGNSQLATLSNVIWRAAAGGSMATLNLQATNVSIIPDQWLHQLPSTLLIDGSKSPLCENVTLQTMLPQLNCK